MNNLESSGYNAIMGEVRVSHDPHDPWGSNIAWLFALADYVYLMDDEVLPGYHPSVLGVDVRNSSSELEMLFEINDQFEGDDVKRVYTILSRYDDWLRLAGKNY